MGYWRRANNIQRRSSLGCELVERLRAQRRQLHEANCAKLKENMKVRIAYLVVLATVCFAQMGMAEALMFVDVPFDFTAGNAQMPAGRYEVSRITENAIALQLESAAKSLFVLTHAAERNTPDPRAELVFDRFGSRYFLAEVWSGNSNAGHALHIPKADSQHDHDKFELNAARN
jgi:hypothetical protein